MKRLLVILLGATMAVALLAGCGSNNKTETNQAEEEAQVEEEATEYDSSGKEYVSDFDPETNQLVVFGEIQFQVPATWTKQDSDNSIDFMSEEGIFTASSTTDIIYDFSDEDIQDGFIAAYSDDETFTLTGKETITIFDNTPALYFTATSNISGYDMNRYELAFSTDTTLYLFVYAERQDAVYNHSREFDGIIESIEPAEEVAEAEEVNEAEQEPEEDAATQEVQEESAQPEEESTPTATAGESNALESAKKYLKVSHYSYSGLIDQLKFEGFTDEEAAYGADNCGADWSEQALLKGQDYLNVSAYSRDGLINQLEFEGFSDGEATNAADNCGADWNEQAALKAQEYLNLMSYSKEDLIGQLEFEGFTAEQAEYGASSVMG